MILMLLAMFAPAIGLPVFWFLPFTQALPIYLFLLVLFAGTMWAMRDAMKRPPMTGAECLIGRTAIVVSRSTLGYGAPYIVRLLGELWSAYCRDSLHSGDAVIVVSVKGNSVRVERKDDAEVFPGSRP
ncbi:MAG: NfeD family protein [Deltaproteobacteria bacterium]|nr:NfeD family protein [Deltaproteobacteria bacterium]